MQTELLNRQRWRTRVELANAMFEYLEIFHAMTAIAETVNGSDQPVMVEVPEAGAPWDPDIWQFALTYDGYGRHADAAVKIAYRVAAPYFLSGGYDGTLDDYRCALFFEQRWWRWQQDGSEPTGYRREWVEDLLRSIHNLSGGQVPVDPHSWAAGQSV